MPHPVIYRRGEMFVRSSIRYCSNAFLCSSVVRACTTAADSVIIDNAVTVEREQMDLNGSSKTIATVIFQRPPINSLNVPFTVEVTRIMKELEDSKEVDAVIFKSLLPVFSAGLDLNELYQTSRDRVELLWQSLQDMWLQIYSSELVTLSLINGHCLAAGTLIAAACDYRIGIEGNYSMGVTAAKVGVVAPPWFLMMLSDLMGKRATEHALQTGQVFSPAEALKVGLIDQVCSSEVAHSTCLQALTPYLAVYQESRKTMKQYLRGNHINDFKQRRDTDKHDSVNYLMRESVQNKLGDYIQQLKKRK